MKKTYLLGVLLLLFLPLISAQANFNEEISAEDRATFDSILEPIMKIYNLIKYTATVIATLVLLLAGVSYMMSGSDPKKRESAKSMGMYVLLGLVIIWAAPLVVQFVIS